MSLIQTAKAKARARALAGRLSSTFEGAAETISATASGGGLIRMGGQLYDAATTQTTGVIAVKNVGRAGAAIYAPATGGAAILRSGASSGSASTAATYHNQLLGLVTGDDHPQYLNTYRADARYVPIERMIGTEAPIYTVDSDDGRLSDDLQIALRRAADSGLQVIGGSPGLAVGVSGLGLSVAGDTVVLTSASDVSAGTSSILASNAGALTLIALGATSKVTTPQIETSAGNLTLAPASGITSAGAQLHTTTLIRTPLIDTASGPLSLKAASNVVQMAATADLQTDHYVSQMTGWRITYPGAADFRYLYTDELHAKAFIADLEQALAGGQIIAKSVALIAEPITVPAAGASVTIRVRDLPSAPDISVFASGDIVRLRKFTRADGSLTIADAWGVVTAYADGTGANQGTQTWTFTRSTAPNAGGMTAGTVIAPDALILDYGTSGNGIYEVSAIDGQAAQNSPYARVATWTGHPATGLTLRSQFGNLRGTYGYSAAEFGVAMGDPTAANITVDATNGIRLRHGTTNKITLSTTGDASFTGNITASSGSITGALTIGTSGGIYQGTGTLSSPTTGLRIWNDSGIGRIGGYNSGALQWSGDTNGKLTAGAGDVTLDAEGIKLDAAAPSSIPTIRNTNTLSWYSGGTETAFVEGYVYGLNVLRLGAIRGAGEGQTLIGVWGANRAMSPGIGMYSGAETQIQAIATYIDLYGITRIFGNLIPNAGASYDIGAAGATVRKVYADEVIAATVTGASLGGSIWQHDAADMYIRSSSASARTLYVANLGAGSMNLDVEGNITLSGTVDGVDIASHAGNVNAHHTRDHVLATNSGLGATHTISGATAGHVLRASGATAAAFAAIQDGDLPSTIVRTTRQVIAGNGLTGGGALSADRTLTLGTPGSATATSTNAVSSESHTHAIDTTIARSAITITAGNGLTGGGDLTANRTLTVGAGTLITVGATTVGISTGATYQFIGTGSGTAAAWQNLSGLAGDGLSHSNGVLAVGAGDGITVGATTVGLTTPGGLSATTTNSASGNHTHAITANVAASALTVASTAAVGTSAALARADHVHAITSSPNPGAAASILASDASGYLRLVRLGLGMAPTRPLDVSGDAGISGQVIAGSGAFSGSVSITNGGDLTVGTVLQVNTAGTRIGINRAADSQFDLDVAGAIRGEYLIGKHAIQLASAVGVWHFDGPAPYNLDYTGSNASHMGVGGTESGGVIYRPGRYGKAVQMAEGTTNYVTNPSFELQSTAGWSVYNSPTISYSTDALYGAYSLSMQTGATTNPYIYQANAPIALATGQTWTVSAYIKAGNASAVGKTLSLSLRENSDSTRYTISSVTLTTVWQRIVVSRTLTHATPTSLDRWLQFMSTANSGDIALIDGVQLEQKAYATPYCDGSLGSAHTWTTPASPHASASSRTGATLTYANNAGLNSDEGSIMMWARHAGMATGGMGLWGTGSNAQFDAYVNQVGSIYFRQSNTNQSVGAGIQPQTWNHYAFTWSKSANTRKIFVNGVERSSRQFDAGATIGSTLFVGSLTAGAAYGTNGEIDEFTLLDYAADPKLIRAIYESDAPVFVESSVFHWRSPSRVPIWVDEFGLWARGVSGNEILGLYGGDPRNPTGNVTKSWGGITMEENDVVIGRAAQAAVHWDDSAGTLLIGKPSASNLLLSGGAAQMRDSATIWGSWSNSGVVIGRVENSTSRVEITSAGAINMINRNGSGVDATSISLAANGSASFSGAITASSGSITGTLTMGASGQITLGSTSGNHISIDAASINLVSATDAGINGFSFRSAVGSANETGYLKQRISTSGSKSAQVIFYGAKFWIDAAATLSAQSATPASPASSAEGNMYVKSNKLIIQYNDAGTVRYKYLDLTGTGVTWTHTTTAP